ncbi:MAG: hypothetical protein HYX73_10430, partial [Acidobacteria bacterium]|nr:hypothetical protein [Acidobacteriota bacterium]
FSLTLNAGDKVKWVTQTAWDVGIAEVEISDDGETWDPLTTVDGYNASNLYQQEFSLYTASGAGTKYFRIKHSGTINPAGTAQLGWQRLENRYAAGQTDVLLGLAGLYFLTRSLKYSALAVKILQRYPGRFWSDADQRWYISLEGAAPGTGNNFWYPFPHGWTVMGQRWSRLFTPTSLFALGLQALEQWFTLDDPVSGNLDGGIQPPGYSEPEHIFSAFYRMGENQLLSPTDAEKYDLAQEFIKGGQYFLTLQATPVGGIVFSKRYPYLYTNIAGFACLALAGTVNPITQQVRILSGTTRMILPQYR